MNQIEKAVLLLNQNEVVGMPTETVYGLAARIDSESGLQKIFSTKQRPFFDPLIVHVSSVAQAKELTEAWPQAADFLAKAFWPGPLTLVLKKSSKVSSLITSGLETVGLRFPSHPVARELIEKVGVPLAAPSANKFGRTSPTSRKHVEDEFGTSVFVLEGGESIVGIESTILSIQNESEFALLRPGLISIEEIKSVLNQNHIKNEWPKLVSKVLSPGALKHHYMPAKPLILFQHKQSKEQLLKQIEEKLSELPAVIEDVQIIRPQQVQKLFEMTLPDSPALAARQLYQSLREAAGQPVDVLVLEWPGSKRSGEWFAVWDRLSKAASLDLN